MAVEKKVRVSQLPKTRPIKRLKTQKTSSKEATETPVATSVTKEVNEDVDIGYIRIVAGSYERLLYGVDAFWSSGAAAQAAQNEQYDENRPASASVTNSRRLQFRPVFIFPAHISCLKSVAIGGSLLASGSADELIKLYDIKRRKELGTLMHHNGTITSMEFYGKAHMISAAEDGKLCIWRTKDWECLRELKGHTGAIHCVSVHPSGRVALTVGADRTLRSWDLTVGGKLSATKLKQAGDIVRCSPDGTQYSILSGRKIDIYNVSDVQVVRTYTERTTLLCMQYAVDQQGRNLLIVGGDDKRLRIYHAALESALVDVQAHDARIKDIAIYSPLPATTQSTSSEWHPTSTLIITVSSSGTIRIWELEALLGLGMNATPESAVEQALIGEYNTGSRLTCVAACYGFAMA